jgi:hypothetical protein
MARDMALTGNVLELALLTLQAFQVVFLWIHDWVPLGRLNDVVAVRSQDTLPHLALVTLIQSVPYTLGLFFSARYFGHFLRVEPERSERFQRMFGNSTHSCRSTVGLSPTPRMSCFTWRPPPRCSSF